MTNTDKLKEAKRLVEEVAADMDTSTKVCGCCQFKVKNNWPQHQLHELLAGTAAKLGRMLGHDDGRLEAGWEWSGPPQ